MIETALLLTLIASALRATTPLLCWPRWAGCSASGRGS